MKKNNDDFAKISQMKTEYDELIKNYVNQEKASNAIKNTSAGGYVNGRNGSPVVFFVGEYCFVLGSGIYKKIKLKGD